MPIQVILHVLLAAATVQGPRVSARASSTSTALGETVIYEVIVQHAQADVDIATPRFPAGLAVQGTQDFSEMQLSFPGGRSITRRREFVLQAITPGRFRVPPVTVLVGRRTYRTNAVEIVVTGAAQPRSIESSSDAWLRAAMRPETVYVGQQATLTVEAGFSEEVRVRLTRPAVFETPSPAGFWVQDIPGGVQSRLSAVNGRITEIQSFQRAYFPLSAGRFAFAPARAVVDVREGLLFAPETREIRSGSPKLTVLPLPDRGKPRAFNGAVGSFSIRTLLQPDTVRVGEAAQVTIEISGTGNVKSLPGPSLPRIPDVEQFEPTEDADITYTGATVGGTKRFQWVIIPQREGSIHIPAVTYAFFDPATRSYRTIRSTPVSLKALERVGIDRDATATSAILGALRPAPRRAPLAFVHTRAFLLFQLVPLLAVVIALLARFARRPKSREEMLLAELRQLRTTAADYTTFLRHLELIVRRATANAAVRNVEMDTRVNAFIERIHTQRFAPAVAEDAERNDLLDEAESIVHELLHSASARGSMAAFALVFALQTAGGEQAYRAGQFGEAARAFERAVASDSTDISGWFNLGNAYYRSNDRGRAIWAWTRAARLAPRDPAITRNLQAAGAAEVLRTLPPLSVRPVEWYFLAAIAWWSAGALLVIAITRRKKSLVPWALVPILIVIVAVTIGIVADGRRYAVAIDARTPLYGDPTVHSPIVRRVQAGAGLDVLERRGEWLRVRTLTQAEGWVESDAVGAL